MRLKQGLALVLLASCWAACASRIKKLPVDPQEKVLAHRLAMEGDVLLRDGKDHLALLKYVEASTRDPYSEVIFNKVAIAYSRLLQFERARRAIDRSVRLNPNYAFGHNTRGIVFLATQDLGGAIDSFRKAIQKRPQEPAFHLNLGHAYLQRGDYENGRQEFLRALSLDPEALRHTKVIEVASIRNEENPEDSYQLAKLFAELGDRETALHHLRRALAAGFKDGRRLRGERAFAELSKDEEFLDLVRSYGLMG